MFGATSPEAALLQLSAYHREGRTELAEVMASEMTEQLLYRKDRDDADQAILVQGLRILAGILNTRLKFKRARATISLLHKQRNRLGKAIGHDFAQAAEDYRLAGCIHANAQKIGAAKKAFKRCEKLMPNHIAAALECAELCGNTKLLTKLVRSAGPVILSNGVYILEIEGRPPADAQRIANILGVDEKASIEGQIIAIKAGEQAKNARLQVAMDSLKPKHDYYTYSSN